MTTLLFTGHEVEGCESCNKTHDNCICTISQAMKNELLIDNLNAIINTDLDDFWGEKRSPEQKLNKIIELLTTHSNITKR